MLKLLAENTASEVWMVDKSFNIGSADDNQLVLQDPTVHAHHARLSFDGKKHWLKDLGTANGTYVNDQRINQRQIAHGDIIRFGDTSLKAIDPLQPGSQQEWCLVSCSNWLRGKAFYLPFNNTNGRLRLGRAKHCELSFAGAHLAKEHAYLNWADDGIDVEDNRSANGTFINEKKIAQGRLFPGDKLRLDVYAFYLFGPGKLPEAPASISKTKHAEPAEEPEQPKTENRPLVTQKSDEPEKRWKTRPTSPGNRPGIENMGKHPDSYLLKIAVIVAVLGALLFAGYWWFL